MIAISQPGSGSMPTNAERIATLADKRKASDHASSE
jgi:hypothetical protein